MAIDFTSQGHIHRTTNLPAADAGGWCFSLWLRPGSITTAYLCFLDMSGSADDIFYNNNGALEYYGRLGSGCSIAGFFDAADVWYHIFGWLNHETGGDHEVHLYGRKISDSSYSSDSAAAGNEHTPSAFKVGQDHYGDACWGELAHFKVWANATGVPCTVAELEAEAFTSRPLHNLGDLIYFNPLFRYGGNYLADLSGTADLSLQNSGTGMSTSDGPPIPWGSAVLLGGIAPAAGDQDVTAGTVASSSVLYPPTVAPQAVEVTAGTVASTSVVYGPGVQLASATGGTLPWSSIWRPGRT